MELLATLGRTLGFSFAAGINLYATVAILGLASRYNWVSLPPQFRAFDSDLVIGTAIVLGAFGPSDIIVRLSTGTLHFVQSFREGPLYATTIFPYETTGGRLRAVHTRHEYTEVSLPGFTSRPEQYYGDCEVLK